VVKIIVIIIGLYLLLLTLGFLFQRHLIYLPSKEIPNPSQWQVADMDIVTITTADGLSLRSWYKPATRGQPTIIYFQGNAGHIGHRGSLIRPYLDQGIGVLLVGYRGYGGNPGKPNEQGFYQDAYAAWFYLKQKKIAKQCIIVYGESIGSGPAIQLASEQPVAALILQSPFTSLIQLGKQHYPIFPIKWLLKDQYLVINKINSVHAPLLVLAAQYDFIVPADLSIKLYEKANRPKQFKLYENIGHNALYPLVQQDVIIFIKERVTKCNPIANHIYNRSQ